MSTFALLASCLSLLMGGGVAALLTYRSPRMSTACGTLGAVAGGLVGLVAAVRSLGGEGAWNARIEWGSPYFEFAVGLDALSGFFLIAVLGLCTTAAVYGREYMLAYGSERSLGPASFFYNLLISGMVVVLVARDALLFLVGWEVMSIAAYLLVSFEHEKPEARRAGWVYLIATHVGTAFLLLMFTLLGAQAGGLEFAAFRAMPAPTPALAAVLFGVGLVGFGVKAGLVPFHVWLPEAHAAAPSHVSSVMSGVMIKMGVYGILRLLTLMPSPSTWWGPTLIVLGLTGGLLGISLALYQSDMKRVLAYSSIENVGLVVLGIGIGLWGHSIGDARVTALGFGGGLLHLWNHVVMKGLMFLSAGSVLHGAGTKDLERLGGLLKEMPVTGAAMLVGAVAIAGLPPMNGFVSEWLLYLGLIERGLGAGNVGALTALLVIGVVALIGGLAGLCFVRLVGIALLGQPRGREAQHAHESSWWMTGPLVLLVALAMLAGLFPARLAAAISRVMAQLPGGTSDGHATTADLLVAPLKSVGTFNAALWIAIAAASAVSILISRRRQTDAVSTWGCGYAAPTPRMQYTGRSFSQIVVAGLLPGVLRSRVVQVLPQSIFPSESRFSSEIVDPLTRGVYEPFVQRWGDRFARLRWMQQGSLHLYLLYVVVVTIVWLAWVSIFAAGT